MLAMQRSQALHCGCVQHHSPPAIVIEMHHILPLSWGGTSTPANKVAVCAQTHYTIHFILNEFVRRNQIAPRNRHWPPYAYALAVRAWDERIPEHPTPYWLPDPLAHPS